MGLSSSNCLSNTFRRRFALHRWSYLDRFPYVDPHRKPNAPGIHQMRYVASVRIANKTLAGTFDWLLMGDDDTVWFLDHVRALVSGLDASVPYYLSDNIGGCCPRRGKCACARSLFRTL